MVDSQQWLSQVGTNQTDEINDITVFENSVYVTGFTRGAIPSGFEKQDIGFDAWVGQYDLASGRPQWFSQLGTDPLFNIPSDQANGIATDSEGNVYIVGETQGTFGSPQGGSDGFLASYDDDGNLIRVQQVGTSSDDVIEDIVIVDDRAYVVGSTKGAFSGGDSEGNREVWVAEYDLNFNQNWVTQFAVDGNNFSEGFTIAVEGDNLFVAGQTRNTTAQGETSDFDGWLGRLDINSPQSAPVIEIIASSERDTGKDLTIDAQGNIYIAGETTGVLGRENFGGKDAWVAQYRFDGNFTQNWLTQVGTPSDDAGKGVITTPDDDSDSDSEENIILVGETEEVMDFDNIRDPNDPSSLSEGFPKFDTNRGSADVFLVQLDSAGNGGNPPEGENQALPTAQIGSSSTDLVKGITTDEFGNFYIAGNTFGDLGSSNAGEADGWLAKYSQVDEVSLEQQFILIDETPDPNRTLEIPLEDNPGFSRRNFVRFQDDNLSFDLNYAVSDDNSSLTGVGFRMHFDSSQLRFDALQVDFPFNIVNNNSQIVQTDDQDLDDNPNTDQFIPIAQFDENANFPGDDDFPVRLARANFTTRLSFFEGATEINFTPIATPNGYELNPQNITVQGRKYTYDIDGNNEISAFSDGVLILRFLFGLRGEALIRGNIVGEGAVRTSAEAIENYLEEAGGGRAFDVDGNTEADALTDGILINRFLFGFRGEELIEGAIADNATREDAASIEEYLQAFLLETSFPEDGGDQNQGGENPDGNADGNNDDLVA